MNDFDTLKKLRLICDEEDRHEIEYLIFITSVVGTAEDYEQRKSAILSKYKCVNDEFYEDLLMEQKEQM